MKYSKEVAEVLTGINSIFVPELRNYIKHDVHIQDRFMTEGILNDEIMLQTNWLNYSLTDINVYYSDSPLKLKEWIDIQGINDCIDTLGLTDSGIFLIYTYQYLDMYGTAIDTIGIIHFIHQYGTLPEITNTYCIYTD